MKRSIVGARFVSGNGDDTLLRQIIREARENGYTVLDVIPTANNHGVGFLILWGEYL